MRSGWILLVEDDETTCNELQGILSESHAVEIARSGPEALQMFTPGRFDLALIDLGIPTVPGDRVAYDLRERDPALATVLITGWILLENDPRLARFDFHLPKPIMINDLRETVAKAMELHDSRVDLPPS